MLFLKQDKRMKTIRRKGKEQCLKRLRYSPNRNRTSVIRRHLTEASRAEAPETLVGSAAAMSTQGLHWSKTMSWK
ncbi:Protein of unknown function [Gryllus bimaculatus]|nr:Protein of unknown function [Gryllus bimaculatus]